MATSLYSIGHGNKRIGDFITQLKAFDIHFLVDVRSKPYSRYNPQYNQPALKDALVTYDIQYVYLGGQLGGIPSNPNYYVNGRVNYELLKQDAYFKEGIDRLIKAHSNNIRLAIMCSESKPHECHRSNLIGRELQSKGINILHILSENQVKEQWEVLPDVRLM